MVKRSAIGLMSGTSCDGLDLLHATFLKENNKWSFEINASLERPYSDSFREQLHKLHTLSTPDLLKMDVELGKLFADQCHSFIQDENLTTDLIASHGHTVYHQPDLGYTLQIGNPFLIAEKCRLPVYADFRSQDVALGGQGAPLVPIGDSLLFSEYDACINLGGFANISFEENSQRLAFDVCAVNLILNQLSQRLGHSYDLNGQLARNGRVIPELLKKLNALDYFKKVGPKSLGREWLDEYVLPHFEQGETADLLRTAVEHIAQQISFTQKKLNFKKVLFTGGGSFNTFLLERISSLTSLDIQLPNKQLITQKEALIFAFLGVLKNLGETNVLSSVTGAKNDHSSGQLFLPSTV